MPLIEELVSRPGVTDVLINSSSGVWVDEGSGLTRVPHVTVNEVDVRQAARFLVARGGRHLDEAHPCIDVRAGEGIRVHAVLPPISTTGTVISIRVAQTHALSLNDLVQRGMLSPHQAELVRRVIAARENIVFAGATGSGKTTLLAAVLGEVPDNERIITVEDTAELRVAHPHVVGLETRQANIEGAGAVTLEELVHQSLRMRPDRVVVGESRGAEFATLLTALNTGHGGVGTTLHANDIASVPARLEALGMLAGLSPELCGRLVAQAFTWVAFLERVEGVRRVCALGRLVVNDDGKLDVRTEPEMENTVVG